MPADHSEPESSERQAVAQESQQKSGTGDHREYARLLRRIDLFGGLDRVVLAKLAAHLRPLAYPSSSIVFRQGDPGDAFYVVASGTVGADRPGATVRDGSGVSGGAVTFAGGGGGGGTGLGSARTKPVVGTAAVTGGPGMSGGAAARPLRRKSTITRYGL